MADSNSKAVTVFAVFVFIISLFSVGVFYLSAKTLFSTISGYATSVGEANLTVESVVTINFTTARINWGSGRVNDGFSSAGLNTFATNNVTNGNWSLQNAGGLRIENLGNVNVTLNLSGTKTAASMIGGTSPGYRWNVTSFESGACRNSSGGTGALQTDFFYVVNTSTTLFCNYFQFLDDRDVVRIDFNLTIPSDSFTGTLGDTITAVAFAA
ncbi:hypothetical protein FJZ21_00865 [Candidatus Pacearchaeota archaeon]|nr:hypothetical protein [Candidatus Pacearchaeota archaeon]